MATVDNADSAGSTKNEGVRQNAVTSTAKCCHPIASALSDNGNPRGSGLTCTASSSEEPNGTIVTNQLAPITFHPASAVCYLLCPANFRSQSRTQLLQYPGFETQ